MNASQANKILQWLDEEQSDEDDAVDVPNSPNDEESDYGPDIVEESAHETDSEQECIDIENQQPGSDNSDDDVPLAHLMTSNNYVVRRKLRNGEFEPVYRWKKTAPNPALRTRQHNIISHLPGPRGSARDIEDPLEIWSLFVPVSMLDSIVRFTNEKIGSLQSNYERSRDAQLTNIPEIRALVGLLYLIGTQKSGHVKIEDVFSADGTGIDIARAVMSLQRFRFLLRCLRFDSMETRQERLQYDKLAPIREVFDSFVQKCKEHFSVGEYVTIDEMLESFRGRCSFRQYLPNKPDKYGIKIFAMVDARNFYTSNMEVYVGSQLAGPMALDTSTSALVKRLIQPISGTNRNVTMDNWFTSVPLAKDLLKDHKLTVVGTMRQNKPEIPNELKAKNREPCSSLFAFGSDHNTLVSYAPKKNKVVLLLSTMHHDAAVNSESAQKKPEIIEFYNVTKGGVDVVDRLKKNYSVARSCRRWPLRIFFTLLDIAGVNAQIILTCNKPDSTMTRKAFLKRLSLSLCDDYLKYRSTINTLPRSLRQHIRRFTGDNVLAREPQNLGQMTRRRCAHCPRNIDRKYATGCISCRQNICPRHTLNICVSCSQGQNEE